ncbi:hypothetical protein GCM10010233_18550 [Streptomyces pseudogriseolus]|uniref:Uncharacterized protein n=6 Tax=Streptomyces TaxID=1883 RepID=A0ABQ2SX47_STREZ|nr:hypothetical protein GCM10010233_18550 [Streptomyces gancidicus]GGS41747.1 hypothetical protein GCM10010285_21520 [Streptomyces rubiginosus]
MFQGVEAAAAGMRRGVPCGRRRASGVPPGEPFLSSRNVAFVVRAASQTRLLGKGLLDLMERTVVRCADGHVFTAASFPMQQAERLGPGRLLRCPRCARLRSVVPVTLQKR